MFYSLEQENQFLKDQLSNTQKFLSAIKEKDDQGQIDQLIQSNNNFLQLNSQLNSMHKSITGVEPGNHEMESLLREKEDEILRLRTQLTSAKDDIVIQLRNKVHQLQDDIKVKTQERNGLIQRTIDLTKQNEDLQGRLRNFEAYMAMVKTLNTQAGNVANENQNLKLQLETINDSHAQSDAQNIQLKTDIVQLQQELSVQAQELSKSRTDLQHSQHATALLQNDNNELKRKVQEQNAKLVEYDNIFNDLSKKIAQLEGEKRTLGNNNQLLQERFNEQQKLLQESHNHIKQYKLTINQYTELMVQMKQCIFDIQAQNQNLLSEQEKAKLEYQDLMTTSTAQQGEHEQIINDLYKVIDFHKKYTQTVLLDYEKLKRKSKDICALNKQLSDTCQAINKEKANIANENDLLRSDLMQSSRCAENQQYNQMAKELEKSQLTIKELKDKEQANSHEKEQLKLLVEQLSQRIEYMMSQYQVLESKLQNTAKNNQE